MKRLIRRLTLVVIVLPLVIAMLALGTANRQEIQINLDPFAVPSPSAGLHINAPLDFVVLVAVAAGVIIGSIVTFLEQGRHRRAARRLRGEMNALKSELARLTMPRPGEKQKLS